MTGYLPVSGILLHAVRCERQTRPICTSKLVTSSHNGGNAWQIFTKYGNVSEKNSTLFFASNAENIIVHVHVKISLVDLIYY